YGSGFLPTVHQGVPFQKRGDPINFVSNPSGVSTDTRHRSIDLINQMNEANLKQVGDPETLTRIAQYELAYRMQSSVPELTDLSKESAKVLEKYSAVPGEASYANNCLLARRLLEKGVRFVHLIHRNWDMHGGGAKGYTVWMAGGGLKPGVTYGATDEWGYWAVEGKTNPLDVFATGLNQLGIDHKKFTYQFQGRPYRLTFGAVEEGRVIKEIIA